MGDMREEFIRVAGDLLAEDPAVAVVLADISVSAFAEAGVDSERLINVGIREQVMVSVAGGLALSGMRPIAHTYAPFVVERAFEQLKLDVSHQDVDIVVASIGASYDASDAGRTHHSPADVSLIASLPGWSVVVPGYPKEVEPLLRRAVYEGRTYLRLSTQANERHHGIDVGGSDGSQGRVMTVRRGGRGTVLAVGPTLDRVVKAAQGLDVTVLYVTQVHPFDRLGLRAATSHPDVIIVEPYLTGTSAASVSAALADLPHRLLCVGVENHDLRKYGTPSEHDQAHGLDVASLGARFRHFLTEW